MLTNKQINWSQERKAKYLPKTNKKKKNPSLQKDGHNSTIIVQLFPYTRANHNFFQNIFRYLGAK